MGTVTATPKGLHAAGTRLWLSVVDQFDLDEHERALLLSACRTADLLDRLAAEADADLTVTNRFGEVVSAPSVVEHRQQSLTLARLLASLRLPSGEMDEGRPQRRGAARGSYGLRSA
jgi:hypothetical protein